ncbi:MAG: HAMP domain-containing protein [Chloroflexi bacterium]|nr:HAMP domain-containing protein [Chloroflexota bacterium]MCI0575216.1 HAMP domain-containing protein [Chloroflexota bacterium]MCI0643824.1 HAMP domain-containing protein [Chloroflexota bacterium]MCI0726078.1 HAMP domain-containing protein [Chloroflexota bacterium]
MSHWSDNFKIRTKIIGPVAILVLTGLLTIGGILLNISRLKTTVEAIVQEEDKLVHAQAALIFLQQQELVEKNFLLTGDDSLMALHTELNEQVVFHIQAALESAAGEEDRALIEQVQANMARYHDLYTDMVGTAQAGDREGAMQLSLDVADPMVAQVHEDVTRLIDDSKASVAAQLEGAKAQRDRAILTSLTSTLIFLVIGVAIVGQARRMTDPVVALAGAAAAVDAGNYNVDSLAAVARRGDELGQLARVFQHMAHQVYQREEKLKQEVQELRIQIDEARRAEEVAEITGSDYFQELQRKARELRQQQPDELGEEEIVD